MCADMIYAVLHVYNGVKEFAKNVLQRLWISIKLMLRGLSRLT